MNLRNTLAILFTCLSFSCKKGGNKEETTFPLILQVENLVKKSEPRLFTANGEIKDRNIINQFIKDQNDFIIPDHFVPEGNNLLFLSKDSAIINGNQKYSVVKDGDLILFYSPKTVLSNNTLSEQIFKYRAALTPIAASTNYNYLTQEVRVGHGAYGKFSFSRTIFALKRGNSLKQSGIDFNDLADNISAKLSTQDTLAYLETALVLSR
jgi:hypothetical protein